MLLEERNDTYTYMNALGRAQISQTAHWRGMTQKHTQECSWRRGMTHRHTDTQHTHTHTHTHARMLMEERNDTYTHTRKNTLGMTHTTLIAPRGEWKWHTHLYTHTRRNALGGEE